MVYIEHWESGIPWCGSGEVVCECRVVILRAVVSKVVPHVHLALRSDLIYYPGTWTFRWAPDTPRGTLALAAIVPT